MKLKVDKDHFLRTVHADVKYAVEQSFYANTPSHYGEQVSVNFNEIIYRAVAAGVTSAMKRLIESQYTDDDFERDIGLKP